MEKETSMLFACNSATMVKYEYARFIDSGCSNHMTLYESLLINVNKTLNTIIKIGNRQIVQTTWKGTFVIETKNETKYIKE